METITDSALTLESKPDTAQERQKAVYAEVTNAYLAGLAKGRDGLFIAAQAVCDANLKLDIFGAWCRDVLKLSEKTAERYFAVIHQKDFLRSLPILSESWTVYYEFARLTTKAEQKKALQACSLIPTVQQGTMTADHAKLIVNGILYPTGMPNQRTEPDPIPQVTRESEQARTAVLETIPDTFTRIADAPAVQEEIDQEDDYKPEQDTNDLVLLENEHNWFMNAQKRIEFQKQLRRFLLVYDLKEVRVTIEPKA